MYALLSLTRCKLCSDLTHVLYTKHIHNCAIVHCTQTLLSDSQLWCARCSDGSFNTNTELSLFRLALCCALLLKLSPLVSCRSELMDFLAESEYIMEGKEDESGEEVESLDGAVVPVVAYSA